MAEPANVEDSKDSEMDEDYDNYRSMKISSSSSPEIISDGYADNAHKLAKETKTKSMDDEDENNEEEDDVGDEDEEDVDDDDDDDDDDLEGENCKKYKDLRYYVKANPLAYDSYVELCKIAHELGDLDYLREAYELFSNAFPLAGDIWLKYLDVRIALAQYEAERRQVCDIFRKALCDYYDFGVAIKLAQFLSSDESGCDLQLWTELYHVYGFNYCKGREIFKLKRAAIANNKNLSAQQKLEQTLDTYLIELKYPLYAMDQTYVDYRILLEKEKANLLKPEKYCLENIQESYDAAKALSERIQEHEQKLERQNDAGDNTKDAHIAVYVAYLDELRKLCRDPETPYFGLVHQLRQTVYERLLAEDCLQPLHWLHYIEYIEEREKLSELPVLPKCFFYEQTLLELVQRALRNCSAENLYIKGIHLLEAAKRPFHEVRALFEKALAVGFPTPEPEVAVCLEYLTHMAHYTDYESEDECDKLRRNFDWSWSFLGRRWGVLADCSCEILQLWGSIEYEKLKNPVAARDLWNTVMASGDNASRSALWVLYAQLESPYSIENARKIYLLALQQMVLDNSMAVMSAWKLLERCKGDSAARALCYAKCDQFVLQHEQQQQKQRQKRNEDADGSTEAQPKKRREKRKATNTKGDVESEHGSEPKAKQAKLNKSKESSNNPFQQQKDEQEYDTANDHLSVFVSNIDYELSEEDLLEELKPLLKITKLQLKRTASGKSRGFGYMQLENTGEVQKAIALDRHAIRGRPIYFSIVAREPSQRKKFLYADGKEVNKLFIKGLPHDCTQKELETLFGQYGKLSDVRLVYHKSGNFKQIAFVEYEQEGHAGKAAMATDKMDLRGHTLTVAISNPPPRPVGAQIDTSTSKISNTLNIRAGAKPRMTLIPTMVRKNLVAKQSIPNSATSSNTTSAAPDADSVQKAAVKRMTNEDFRKLLN